MVWTELKDQAHARQCISHWFGNIPGIDQYAHLAAWLSDQTKDKPFVKALESLSACMWPIYLVDYWSGSNRLTRTIQRVGTHYGFRSFVKHGNDHHQMANDHVVYFNTIDADTFVAHLRDKVLWKDSFATLHGEFSHSYQWLAAAQTLPNFPAAQLFADSGKYQSIKPIYHMTSKGIVKEPVYLWEWLVDSLNAKDKGAFAKHVGSDSDPSYMTLNGHCFSNSWRHPNNLHACLVANREQWFLGHYAARRDTKLLNLALSYHNEVLLPKLESKELTKNDFSREITGQPKKYPQARTQAAVQQNYLGHQKAGDGKVASSGALYKGRLRPDAHHPGPYRIFNFHGIKGQAPVHPASVVEKKPAADTKDLKAEADNNNNNA